MNDQDITNAFVDHLRKSDFSNLKVDRRPDKENRKTSDIDAIAGHFAIEHTSIDTLPSQRRNSNWFIKAVDGIEKELPESLRFPFRLNITIEYTAVTKGQDWAAIRNNLRAWIINESPNLADGSQVLEGVQRVPFHLHVRKTNDRHTGIFFARFEPNDDTLPKRIRKQFDRKAKKLKKYHDQGKTTVLLIENDDIALINEFKILDAIQKVYPTGLPNDVDKIWYADTSIPDDIKFIDFTHKIVQRDKSIS